MNVQLKKGVLETLVLASLKEEDGYGYDLVRKISKYMEFSESSLYPILRRLVSDGYASTYSVEIEGRFRKYFKITRNGELKLKHFCDEWADLMEVYKYIEGVL